MAQYAVDYDDETIGSDVWFTEDDASTKWFPARSQRSGVLVFTNQSDAVHYLRIPQERPDGGATRRDSKNRNLRHGDCPPAGGGAGSCRTGEGHQRECAEACWLWSPLNDNAARRRLATADDQRQTQRVARQIRCNKDGAKV